MGTTVVPSVGDAATATHNRVMHHADTAKNVLYAGKKSMPRKFARRHKGLGTCLVLTIITLVLVPACAFGFSALLAIPLWQIECAEIEANGDDPGSGENNMCSYYQWFKYILGNLVGLGNPLTNVGPASGHVGSETLDLLISTWALAMVGTSVGIISGLVSVTNFALEVEGSLKALFLCDSCAYGDGLDRAEFIAKLREEGFTPREVSDRQADAIFKLADEGDEFDDGRVGFIKWDRAKEIFRSMHEVVDRRLIWQTLDKYADPPVPVTPR